MRTTSALAGLLLAAASARAGGPLAKYDALVRPADRVHWAFRPVRPVPVPAVRDVAWGRNPIDAFVLARLEQRGWKPAPPATRTALLRRVYLDLTGLPPSPEEQQAFLGDPAPDAYERLVGRLL